MSQGRRWSGARPNWIWLAGSRGRFNAYSSRLGYWRAAGSGRLRILAGGLKILGVIILALCLLDPLLSGTRARPAPINSSSSPTTARAMTLRDRAAIRPGRSSSNRLRGNLPRGSRVSARILTFVNMHSIRSYAPCLRWMKLEFDGRSSSLGDSLSKLLNRYKGRPLAGVILFTDGNATDTDAIERVLAEQSAAGASGHAPPIYPVVLGRDEPGNDVSLQRVAVTQTNFEDAPVTLAATIQTSGYRGRNIIATLLDNEGKQLEQQKAFASSRDGEPLIARFRFRPEKQGVFIFHVTATVEGTSLSKGPTTAQGRANRPAGRR